eukprot:Skav211411  [mRNA]  locus=scaffold1528:472429:473977:+ [translate_table: standard]
MHPVFGTSEAFGSRSFFNGMASPSRSVSKDSLRSPSPEISENYAIIRPLGAGKYGQVNEVLHLDSMKRFAWKQILSEKDSPDVETEVIEVEVLRKVKHQNIIQIYEVFTAPGVVDMVLELCSGGSMQKYMRSRMRKCDGESVYSAPGRLAITKYYTEKCDIYSLGVLLIALHTGHYYWNPESCENDKKVEESRKLLDEEGEFGHG